MKIAIVLMLFTAILFLSGCSNIDPNLEYNIKKLHCFAHDSDSYVHRDKDISPQTHNDSQLMELYEKLCNEKQERFAESNLLYGEAQEVMKILFKNDFIVDGHMGMPSDEPRKLPKLDLEDYWKRISLKKIKENTYEAFYFEGKMNGYYYFHIEFVIVDKSYEVTKTIEKWRIFVPV